MTQDRQGQAGRQGAQLPAAGKEFLPADTHFHVLGMREKKIDVDSFLGSLSFGIDIGIEADDAEERARIIGPYPRLFMSVGMYPGAVQHPGWRTGLETLAAAVRLPRVIAVGEIGLDLHWKYGTLSEQIELFEGQIALADHAGLPVIVHTRDADTETIDVLSRVRPRRGGVIHCFSSGIETAMRLIDLGFFISFAGNCTYPAAKDIREAARLVPLDRLLVETDAPYLAPQPVRGTVNTPREIVHTYRFIADIRNMDPEELIFAVGHNIGTLFGTPGQRTPGALGAPGARSPSGPLSPPE